MLVERIILFLFWVITLSTWFFFIPKNKKRQAHIAFLFMQIITWLFGLLTVHLELIEYPVRLFHRASESSFTFEYFVYPTIAALFNLHFPNKRKFLGTVLYYIYFSGGITLFEFTLERNTDLIHYHGWTWSWSFITLTLTLLASRIYYKWFFNIQS